MGLAADGEVDLHLIRARHPQAELLGVGADFVVIHREPGGEDYRVEPMERRPTEAVLLGKRGERGGGRVGGDAEDEIVVGVNIALQRELPAVRRERGVGEVEVAAAGDLVGKKFPPFEVELGEAAVAEAFVKHFVSVPLDGERRVVEEGKVLHRARVGEVDEDADALAPFGLKHGAEEAGQVEGREGGFGGCVHKER